MERIAITDIAGFHLGQVQDSDAATGCTVVICPQGAVCGVDVRGGAPGTRDTDALNPVNNREYVHAVLFAGGSAYGLDAAGGVMQFLEERGIGRDMTVTVVPNVCAAILFDLKCGRSDIRPDAAMGYAACQHAFSGAPWQSGNRGAGTGAIVGGFGGHPNAMKGGIGAAAFRYEDLTVGAIAAVNCVGDVFDNATGRRIAGSRAPGGGFADVERLVLEQYQEYADLHSGGNTLLACVVTNARLNKAQATKLATLGHDGIARAVRPAHTVFDGDTVFAMCTGEVEAKLDAVGILAARAVEQAILDAVQSAETFRHYLSARDYKE